MTRDQRIFRLLLAAGILLTACGLDLATKNWAETALKFKRPMDVLQPWLEWRYAENTGVAFSFFADSSWAGTPYLLMAVQGTVFVFLLVWLVRQGLQSFAHLAGISLILGGAMGNLYDRLRNGYVIDWIHFHYKESFSFPIFNLADVVINLGIYTLVIHYFVTRKQAPQEG